jgi:hypothetical protein
MYQVSFHVLRTLTRFRRYRGRQIPFSCFPLPDMILAGQRVSNTIFMFCAPKHVFGSTRFLVLFSCFARSDSFSTVPRASGPVFMFCTSGLIFKEPRASALDFMFCVPGLVFCGTEGVGSRFHDLRVRSHFRWYRGHRVSFSCLHSKARFPRYGGRRARFLVFALPDSFSAVPRASCPVFMFCAPELIFIGTEGVGSRFHVLSSQTHFRQCRVRLVPFSYFARPDSFSAVPRASDLVFMFSAPGHVLGSAEGVGFRFHVLRSMTRFRWYRGHRVLFSYFAIPSTFSAVRRVSGLDIMFSLLD